MSSAAERRHSAGGTPVPRSHSTAPEERPRRFRSDTHPCSNGYAPSIKGVRAAPASREILYSQSWEDPEVDRRALRIRPDDDLFTIAASGDNALAFLLDEPRSVTALDTNRSQCHLLELKMAAVRRLSHGELIDFVGVLPSRDRRRAYRRVRDVLSDPARRFWDARPDLIGRGIIHVGRFERYLRTFRRFILPLVHSRSTRRALFSCRTLREQRDFHQTRWDGVRWRLLFRVFFHRAVMARLGRDPRTFRYVDVDVGSALLDRVQRGLTETPTRENWFLAYMLCGSYEVSGALPAYLTEESQPKLRRLLSRVTIVHDDAHAFLAGCRNGSFSKYCLSDIFEYLGEEEAGRLFGELRRTGRDEGTLSYREMMVPRTRPDTLSERLVEDAALGRACRRQDRTFFYGAHHVVRLRGESVDRRTPATTRARP